MMYSFLRANLNAEAFLMLFYVGAGISHFLFKDFLVEIMPPQIPMKELVVYATGLLEILLGAALLKAELRAKAAWLIIIMLTSYLWVHVYMLLEQTKFIEMFMLDKYTADPSIFFSMRIFLQFVMIYWIYAFTQES